MRVRVLSRVELEAGGAEGADAVISSRGSTDAGEPELAIALAQATGGESAHLLRLSFDAIGVERYRHFVGANMAQITDVIEFGRRVVDGGGFFDGPATEEPLIAIHCEHGKSRSAAIAVALLADHLGDGRDREAVNALLRGDVENRMQPNPLVISLADNCLFRYGRINAALSDLCPRYAPWRRLWRPIAADPDAYWGKNRRRDLQAPRSLTSDMGPTGPASRPRVELAASAYLGARRTRFDNHVRATLQGDRTLTTRTSLQVTPLLR
jgi:predicted protein tyrosine phosphatase